MKPVIVLLPCYLFMIIYTIRKMLIDSNTESIFLWQNLVLYTLVYIASIMDINKREISNLLIVTGVIEGVFFNIIKGFMYSYWHVLWGLAGGIAIFIILVIFVIITRKVGALGGGDIKILSVIGLSWSIEQTLICILLSCLFGLALFGVLRILRRTQTNIPLAPAIMMAMAVMDVIMRGI